MTSIQYSKPKKTKHIFQKFCLALSIQCSAFTGQRNKGTHKEKKKEKEKGT